MGKKGSWFGAVKKVFSPESKEKKNDQVQSHRLPFRSSFGLRIYFSYSDNLISEKPEIQEQMGFREIQARGPAIFFLGGGYRDSAGGGAASRSCRAGQIDRGR